MNLFFAPTLRIYSTTLFFALIVSDYRSLTLNRLRSGGARERLSASYGTSAEAAQSQAILLQSVVPAGPASPATHLDSSWDPCLCPRNTLSLRVASHIFNQDSVKVVAGVPCVPCAPS